MNTSTASCGNDGSFGPIVLPDCRGGFDLTLYFEQVFLLIVPCVLILFVSPWRVLWLLGYTKKTTTSVRSEKLVCISWEPSPVLTDLRQACVCIFSCQQLALAILWANEPAALRTRAALASSFLSFVSSVSLLLLSSLEHCRSIRPSFIINIYLLFSLLFDTVIARTMWLGATSQSIAGVFTAGVGIKVAMLFMEASEKRKYLGVTYSQLPPEDIAGILNRSVFWWLNGLFLKGFQSIINHKDLYALDEELSSESSRTRAMSLRSRIRRGKRHDLLLATTRLLLWPLLGVVPPRLCLIAFTYAQPALINKIVDFAGNPPKDGNKNPGYGLIGATLLVYCGIAVSNVHANHAFNRVLIMVRGTMIGSIYEKMLRLRSDSPQRGSAVTLMSTDIDRICTVLEQVNSLWAGTIEVVIALVLLEREVGLAAVAPLCFGIG